jgi:soluble lytic murein transglycosylase
MLGLFTTAGADILQAPKPLTCQDSFDLAVQTLKKDRPPLLPDKKACPIEHKTIAWIQYTRSPNELEAITQFLIENPFWPDQEKLREMAEQSIEITTPNKTVIQYFTAYPPVTSKGALVYAERLWKTTTVKAALPKIEYLWIHTDFKPKDEQIFYRLFKSFLSADAHHKRLDRLILDGNYYGLKQMKQYISKKGRQVVDYAITLIQKKNRFQLKWTGVPSCYKQYPGLTFQYLKWLRDKKQDLEALKIFEEAIASGAFVEHPDLLLRYRNYFARYFLHAQDYQKAYEISEKYPIDPTRLKSKVDYTEGEWLTAWLELRKLQKLENAKKRFEALYNFVSTSISKSKMAYWCGRAEEAAGNKGSAKDWYQKSADLPHTYYGQISLKKLGDSIKIKLKQDAHPVTFTEQESHLIQSLKLLAPYGFGTEKEKILLYLAKNGQDTLGEILVDLCHETNMPHLAVIVAKFMSQKRPVLTEKAYPILKLPPESLSHAFIDEVLVHAVIRQESNFNSRSISTAGARGFMQLMYTTANKVARKLGIKLHWQDLTKQPHTNIKIGSAYLSSVLKRFKGNYILALAGYNAGPDKAEEWVKVYGDPDSKEVDIVDWIESIPYGETRGYIQRITETLPIYAERLGKKSLYP